MDTMEPEICTSWMWFPKRLESSSISAVHRVLTSWEHLSWAWYKPRRYQKTHFCLYSPQGFAFIVSEQVWIFLLCRFLDCNLQTSPYIISTTLKHTVGLDSSFSPHSQLCLKLCWKVSVTSMGLDIWIRERRLTSKIWEVMLQAR